jgi:hypothetical protein
MEGELKAGEFAEVFFGRTAISNMRSSWAFETPKMDRAVVHANLRGVVLATEM